MIDQNQKINTDVLYLLNTPGFHVQLHKNGWSYDFYQSVPSDAMPFTFCHFPDSKDRLHENLDNNNQRTTNNIQSHRIDFDLVGCNPDCEIITSGQSQAYWNYYTTGTPEEGVTHVRAYSLITYKNIYPGIDLTFQTDPKQRFKYLFLIHTEGDYKDIRIKIHGAEFSVDSASNLNIFTGFGLFEEAIPYSYQIINQEEVPIDIVFTVIDNQTVGFYTNQQRDERYPLVIDPIPLLQWSTYFGGEGGDGFQSIALHDSNEIYLIGQTSSTNNIATAGAFQQTYAGQNDGFLAKFDSLGSLIWATYIGGWEQDVLSSIDFDCSSIYTVGTTKSSNNIATTGAFQVSLNNEYDAFIERFTFDGNRLWGSYCGGPGLDYGKSCQVFLGNIYFGGSTISTSVMATSNGHQPFFNGGESDAFLEKFDTNGQRIWGTYYGGEQGDGVVSSSVLNDTSLLLIGVTTSETNIATPGCFQTTLSGMTDGFIFYLDSTGGIRWGTYFGGEGQEDISSIASHSPDEIIAGGNTTSANNIGTIGTYQPVYQGNSDGFLIRFDAQGNRIWGSYYGSTNQDDLAFISIDDSSNIFFAGGTKSTENISTDNAYQTIYGGGIWDGFISKFDAEGNRIWGSYFGSVESDGCFFIFPFKRNLYIGGTTNSQMGIATPDAYQTIIGGQVDGFLARFLDCQFPSPASTISGPVDVCAMSDSILYFVSPITNASSYIWHKPQGTTIISGESNDTIILTYGNTAQSGYLSVKGYSECGVGDSSFIYIAIHPRPEPSLTGDDSVCQGEMQIYHTDPGQLSYSWECSSGGNIVTMGTLADDSIIIQWTIPGNQWIQVNYSDTNGCTGIGSTQKNITVISLDSVQILISVSQDSVCIGTPVTFTATSINGGTSPTFQWQVNGINAGTNNHVFTYVPASGDQVSCILTSNETCTTNNPATSDTITMIVNPLLPVFVTISASLNPICSGTPVTFTATPVNGGTSPTYQWKVNANNAGMNHAVFTYYPVNGDVVSCILTSHETCTSNNPATSNPVVMNVIEAPDVSLAAGFDTITTTHAKPILLRGGIPLGGTYSGSGVTSSTTGGSTTFSFDPSLAGPGIHEITYRYTNYAGCLDSAKLSIINYQLSIINCGDSLTDIRDNKKYPTVQIGSQCWMAAGLNYGIEISSALPQRDNCIPEKYSRPSSIVPHPSFYQWDEVMQYRETEAIQGLCPPGWHVPSETDWEILFSNWTNNAFAGKPLLWSGFSGFNALLTGVEFFNRSWEFEEFTTFFWSSTSHDPRKAWAHGMNEYNYSVSYYPSYRVNAFSVRCVRD